ncbi:MAG TPA: response regulator transcription factor [Verrucomicrobiae bacterium]|nr:response regulator transcription factor [Verrucomicrobiae bacterium]
MKLLVIDDNRALIRSLRDFLGKDYVVDSAETAKKGLQRTFVGNYDVIILDICLPDELGNNVCRKIRKAGVTTPIIVLTAQNAVLSRVELLNSGADDYLTKPFSLLELRARLHALFRRAPAGYHASLSFADLTLDIGKRHVQRAGQDIHLRRKEFDILEYLVRNSGQVVTRAMIIDHVWESDADRWNNTVDVHIKHLRDKIDRPFNTPLIKTAYGVGYVMNDISVI